MPRCKECRNCRNWAEPGERFGPYHISFCKFLEVHTCAADSCSAFEDKDSRPECYKLLEHGAVIEYDAAVFGKNVPLMTSFLDLLRCVRDMDQRLQRLEGDKGCD